MKAAQHSQKKSVFAHGAHCYCWLLYGMNKMFVCARYVDGVAGYGMAWLEFDASGNSAMCVCVSLWFFCLRQESHSSQ